MTRNTANCTSTSDLHSLSGPHSLSNLPSLNDLHSPKSSLAERLVPAQQLFPSVFHLLSNQPRTFDSSLVGLSTRNEPNFAAVELLPKHTHNTFHKFYKWVTEWLVMGASQEEHQRFSKAQVDVYGRASFGWAYWSLKNVNQ